MQAHARLDLDALLTASRSRDLPQLARLSETAQGGVLEMYPRYHWLIAQVETLSGAEARDFLDRYADTPLAERFRAEWLKELGRRQDWAGYAAEYSKLENPPLDLRCFHAQATLNLGRDSGQTLASVRPAWFSGQQQPASCAPVFDAMFAQGLLTGDDAWARIRLTLAVNNIDLAAAIAGRTEASQTLTLRQLANLRAQPEKGWPQPAHSRAGREMALFVLDRIARTEPEKAAGMLREAEARWPQADRNHAWRTIALRAAQKHMPQANTWFEAGSGPDLDDETRAWSIRAALRSADWQTTLRRIDALPDTDRASTTWRYWRARALRELGRQQEANQELIAIASGYDFYSLLAREELGSVLEPLAVQYRASEVEIRQIQQLPAVRRAQALFEQNWRTDAVREWNWAMRGQNDQMLLAAAEYARRQGWYDRAIFSAERTRELHNFALRYLAPHRSTVEKQAAQEGLEPAWVYGLMRQESRFVADIKSRVGASGLMQLMPATAKWVAGKLGWKQFDPESVTDIDINVTLGSRYLGDVWKQLGNSQVLASAGYNAGPGRARAWQADTAMDAAIYIENIPFTETRDYVKRVMANAVHYAQLFGSGQTSLTERIGVIPPKDGNNINLP